MWARDDRPRVETSEIARRAAWRVVQIGGEASEALKQACEETTEFETVGFSTVMRYVKQIRDNEELAAVAEAQEYDPVPVGALEPSDASMQYHPAPLGPAESSNVVETGLPLEERRKRWIAEATERWKEKVDHGETRGLKAIMKSCSQKYGADAAFSGIRSSPT